MQRIVCYNECNELTKVGRMQQTRMITHDELMTLKVWLKVLKESEVYTNNNEVQILGFEEEEVAA